MAFWRSYAHLVWATKDRQPFITAEIEKHLYAQIVKKASELGCYVYAINGMFDHSHVVLTTPPKDSVSFVVKELKGASSHFVNHILRPPNFHFEWQRGYGYLTLGQTQLERAVAYVEAQKTHHANYPTNGWLERYSDIDSGPDELGATKKDGVLREEPVVYNPFGEFPF